MANLSKNMIETVLDAAKQPIVTTAPNGLPLAFYPGEFGDWNLTEAEHWLANPLQKKAHVTLHDTTSFIKYVNKHKQDGTQIYINADFSAGSITVTAIIDGHSASTANWGMHRAEYNPRTTPSARRWLGNNCTKMNQADFAAFLTNCARDIVSKNPDNEAGAYPTAAEVLDFALNLEYTEKTTFKQGYREQDGRINFTFLSEDAGKTETNLKAFERFAVALTPYQGGDPYFVEALLKFRIDKNSGSLLLWYELQHIEAVIERATADITEALQKALPEVDIYFGRH